MLQWIWWYLNGLKGWGDQRAATPKKIPILKILLSLESSWKFMW